MKKKFINIRSPLLRALAGSFALLSLLVLVMPQNAQASLAANTQITNGATLTYNDGAAVRTATASVTVKVSLVPAAPTIVAGPNQSTQYAGPATTLTDTFTITSGSNGPDTYNLTTAVTVMSTAPAPHLSLMLLPALLSAPRLRLPVVLQQSLTCLPMVSLTPR